MRIHLKCSCGAEATWENDNDTEVSTAHMTDLADRWHMDHAKCRDVSLMPTPSQHAAPPEPAKECEHTYVLRSNTAGKFWECTKCLHRMNT